MAEPAALARPKVKFLRIDGPRQARLRAAVLSELLMAQALAARHLRTLQDGTSPEALTPAKEMSTRTKAALVLAQGTMAAERARTMSEAPRELGVVVVHARLEDTPQNRLSWEERAQRLNEARAIEAVAIEKKP